MTAITADKAESQRLAVDLAEILNALARLDRDSVTDPEGEHERWALYLRAMDHEDRVGLLFDAVGLESDPSVALSLVLRMFEKLPAAMRETWADQISSEKKREFARARIGELDVLRSAEEGLLPLNQAEGAYQEWTDWLQLKLADAAADNSILELLADRGRTKRIRRIASDRIRLLRET
jgi:hypothetical protein